MIWYGKCKKDNWPADGIHGDRSQNEREAVLDSFRRGKRPILVATDVAARGLDVKDVMIVINYDFPNNVEDYVHRIGRTARGDEMKGTSYAFYTSTNSSCTREFIDLLKDAVQEVPDALYNMMPYRNDKKKSRYGNGGGNNRYGQSRSFSRSSYNENSSSFNESRWTPSTTGSKW